ncbi:hypothetical protein DE146DRAFT_633768 [Phaeosphaeria sp. MPI-PUGE-AT-0046c]|nr:hypothetical protein DE146DRAFT_633768 [Phaeosphaeria sp. MPI-PUGE-AT-0046c]
MASSLSTISLTDAADIASYNRGPITSLLSLPASCTRTLTYNQEQVYFGHYHEPYDEACIALGTLKASEIAPATMWGEYYYSPAICPMGWTVAATFRSSFLFTRLGTGVPSAYHLPLGPDTSAALCCPSYVNRGYPAWGRSDDHVCASSITRGQSIKFIAPSLAGLIYNAGSPMTTTATGLTLVKGDGIPIWWQSTDTEMLSSVAAATSTSWNEYKSGHSIEIPVVGLSIGAKTGIGIGVSALVIASLLLTFFLLRKRWNRTNVNIAVQRAEVDASKLNPLALSQELDDSSRYEMPQAIPEIAGARGPVHELGGGRHN